MRLDRAVPANGSDISLPYTITEISTGDLSIPNRLTGHVTIRTGSDRGTITIMARQDNVDEGDSETLVFTLNPGTYGSVTVTSGPNNSASITITDDDPASMPSPSFGKGNSVVVQEINPEEGLRIRAEDEISSPNPRENVIGKLFNGATGIIDENEPRNPTYERTADRWWYKVHWDSSPQVQDCSTPCIGWSVEFVEGTKVINIDSSPPPRAVRSVIASRPTIPEASGRTEITVRLNRAVPANGSNISLPYTITEISTDDLSAPNELQGYVVIQAGSDRGTVTIMAQQDNVDEGDSETLIFTLNPGTYGSVTVTSGPNNSASITITDDDDLAPPSAPLPRAIQSVRASDSIIPEASGRTEITVRLDRAVPADGSTISLPYTITGISTDDLSVPNHLTGHVTIRTGSDRGTVTIMARQDNVDEGDSETLVFTLNPGTYGSVTVTSGPNNSASITITDDDPASMPSPSFGKGNSVVVQEINPEEGLRIRAEDEISSPNPRENVIGKLFNGATGIIDENEPRNPTYERTADRWWYKVHWDSSPQVQDCSTPCIGWSVEFVEGTRVINIDSSPPPRAIRSVIASHPTIPEAGGRAEITVRLDRTVPADRSDISLPYIITGISTGDLSVPNRLTGHVTIRTGSDRGTVTIMAQQDTMDEGAGEILVFTLNPGTYGSVTVTSGFNNSASITITDDNSPAPIPPSGGAPDWTVPNRPTVSDTTLDPGEEVKISAIAHNEGTETAAPTEMTYYLSLDSTINSGDRILIESDGAGRCKDDVRRTPAGGTSSETADCIIPSDTPAGMGYHIGACVDEEREESNRNNNCSPGAPVRVIGSPDWTVPYFRLVGGTTLDPGQEVTIEATARNEGTEDTGRTKMAYYLSIDSTIDSGDRRLIDSNSEEPCEDRVINTLPGETAAPETEDCIIPSDTPPGMYHIGACMDEVRRESNTDNNCSHGVSVTISELPSICDRTPQVKAEIFREITTTNCADIPRAQLNTVTYLNLSGNRNGNIPLLDFTPPLKSGDFANLPNLRSLFLGYNNLVSLDENLFDGLLNLQRLNLHNNNLTLLPENLFDGLSSLQDLNLDSNNLTSLHENLFDGLSNLQDLDLENSNLTSLHENLFDELSNLQDLDLRNNNLTSLHENLFDELSNLQDLGLRNNNLTSLPEGLFDGLSNLEYLSLERNNLDSLHENLFDELLNLQHLVLNSNNLSSLNEELLDGLSNLQSLRLNSNNLRSLPAGFFNSTLNTLTYLTLDSELRGSISIEPRTANIGPGETRSLTVRLTNALPAPVRLTITAGGTEASSITLPNPATVTIPAGMTFSTFDITLATGATIGHTGTVSLSTPALLYTDAMGNIQANVSVVNSLVNELNIAANTHTFTPQPPGTINICNRTPEVETAILAVATVTETNCVAVPQTQLNTVTALNLSGSRSNLANTPHLNSLPPLMASDFSNLSNLQTLDLRYNDLTSLPTGIFNDVLDTLTDLEIDDNLKSTVTVEPRTADVVPDTTRTLTVRLTNALPAPIRLTITTDGTEASNIIAPATVAIPAGMTFSTFDITLTSGATIGHTGIVALNTPTFLYAGTTGNTLTNINPNVVNKLVRLDTATNAHTFTTIAQPLGAINICSRTPEVEAAILAEITETNCAFVPLVQLNTILELNLRNALSEATTTLMTGDFANLSNLQELRLGSNNLTSLHENLFNELLNLQYLELDRNNLTLLHEDLFDGLTNLQRLELNDNNLTLLHENLFDELSNLQHLELYDNNLTSLHENLFDGLLNLQHLDLDDNNLTSLHEDLFDGLSALQYLDLRNDDLISLPIGIFNDVLATLTFLRLDIALKGTISIEPRTANVAPGATRILTAQLNKTLPASIRFTITAGGADANNITAPATVTIPAGAMATTFNITLAAEAVGTGIVALHSPVILYADAMNNTQQNSDPDTINGLVNTLDAAADTFTFPINVTVNICNRTPEVETAILDVATVTETDCSAVPQTQLNTIVELDLSGTEAELYSDPSTPLLNSTPPLKNGDFSNLHNLQELNLSDNNLTSLHENLFDELFNLQNLDLGNSNLNSLHENLFDGLSTLRHLGLHQNNLTSLHENLFDELSNLRNLRLDSNDLTSLHENAFDGLPNLHDLELRGNNLTSLHEDLFDELSNLYDLDLSSNNLTSLNENVFDGLSNLRNLYLYSNNLTLLHENLFGELSNLRNLGLAINNLTSLHENLFGELSNLRNLYLYRNNLTSLYENLFDGLSNLQSLGLNNNNLHSLPAGIFDDALETLTRLRLDPQLLGTISIEPRIANVAPGETRTLIAQLTKSLPAAVRLTVTETGDITAPATITIPAGMTSATFNITLAAEATVGSTGTVTLSAPVLLYTDTLGYTRANTEHSVISSLVNPLDAATTTHTLTAAQPPGTVNICGRTPQVETAILAAINAHQAYSNIVCANVTAQQLAAITDTLIIYNQGITSLQANDFDGLRNLTGLELENNDLITLPPGIFEDLTSLTTLSLEGNNLNLATLPPGVFNDLTALLELNLSDTHLTMLPSGVFSGLTTLRILDLEDNDLTTLHPDAFSGLTALENLDLRGNNLTMLPAGVFDEVLDTLSDLDLDDTLRGSVSIEPRTANIVPSTPQTLTAQLTRPLPSPVRLTVTKTGNITAPATVTIPAGMTSATFGITFATGTAAGSASTVTLSAPVLLYTDALGNTRANTAPDVVFSLVNLLDAAANTHTLTAVQPPGTVNICSRTPEVETTIILQITETNCAAVPQAQLNTVTMLDLSGTETEFDPDANIPLLNSILPLKAGDFTNLPNLQTLNLSRNNLTSLPENIFDGLSNLETLDLHFNNLPSLPENIFSGLSNLEILDLHFNNLTSLPENVFEGLSNLRELYLEETVIWPNSLSLPDNVFESLSNLQILTLDENQLTFLPEGLFDGLSSLRSLNLSSNNLTSLPIGIFNDALGTLTELRLDNTLRGAISIEPRTASIVPGTIQTLTAQLTRPLPTTVRLTITETGNITAPATIAIPAGMTSATFNITLATGTAAGSTGTAALSTPVLLYTDALGNTRENTEHNVVFNLVNPLNAATTTHTLTAAQPPGTINICDRTPQVETAILAAINAHQAYSNINCPNVTTQQLAAITDTLIIYNQGITSLQANDFDGLRNLTGLELENNDLTTLPPGVFEDLTSLTILSLEGNNLDLTTLLSGVFNNLTALLDLNLSDTHLTMLSSGAFSGLTTLTDLDLKDNDLTALHPDAFSGLTALEDLDLRGNNLTMLPVGVFDEVLDTLLDLDIDDTLRGTVSIEPRTASIMPGTIQTFTAQLTPPSPATVRLTITAGGVEAGNVTLPDPAAVTIPAGMTSTDFDITLTGATPGNTGTLALSAPALIYTDTNGEEQRSIAVVNSLVNASTETSTFTVAETRLVATLTRNSASTEEGTSPTPGIFTLALSNAPDDLSTVTYTLAVSGDNADPADISAEFGGGAVGTPDTSGASNIFTITDDDASATLAITPEDDADATDEVVTLTIISIEFARISIGPNSIQGADVSNGALAITIFDDDPTATYDLEDSTASEPTSSTATDATTATFTITLSRLNTAQMDSPNRRFFFRVAPNDIGAGDLTTPGYGNSLPMGIDSDSLASSNDFKLSLEYQLENGPSVVEFTFHNTGTAQETFSSVDVIPKAAGDTEEVYRFHIIPTHDDDDEEGAERVLFGYRVHFSGQDSHGLTGVVNGSAAAPAAAIRESAAIQPPETVNICDRTPEVVETILEEADDPAPNCLIVPRDQLNAITEIEFLIIPSTTLKNGDFADLPNLRFLTMNAIDLTSLPENLFDDLSTSLQTLDLGFNSLTALPERLFDSLSSLQDLFLDSNNLASLPEDLFDGLSTGLQRLDLSFNNLTALSEGLFDGLSSLRVLYLNDNDLASLSLGLFNDVLDTLTRLTLDAALKTTVSIEPRTASIMSGTIQTLTAQLTGTLPSTMRFTVTKTGNITAPATVTIPAGMTSATFDITLATETAVGNAGTVTLSTPVLLYTDALGNTRANTEPNVVFSLVNPLDTAANTHTLTAAQPLETVNICSRTPEVETAIILQITETNCAAVPQTQLNTVTMLDISGTETEFDPDTNIPLLNSIPPLEAGDFANLSNLQTLNLSRNDLTSLPENIFGSLSTLQILTLDENQLTFLPEGLFDGLSSLRSLDLGSNNLTSLPVGIFNDALGTLTELRLDGTLRDAVSIEPRTASIVPGTIQTLTAQLTGTLPSTVRLTVTKTGNITAPTTVTIPAGITSATFDIALATKTTAGSAGTVTLSTPVLLYTDALGNTRANTEPNVVFSLMNPLDTAANIFTFITPDTTADYDSTADITITEGGGTASSAERTLTLGYAPHAQATVSFELTGGTLGVRSVAANHDLIFTVGDGETDPAVGTNGMTNGRFNIPAGTTSVILTFKAITDTDGDDETITFRITGIEFSDSGTATDIPTAALPSRLTIRIIDAGADAIVIVDDDDTSISELLPGSTGESAIIRVKLTSIPSSATSAVIDFTLGGTATREIDYTVTLAGSSTAADSVTITNADIAGTAPGVPQGGANDSAEATLTFRALNDSADIENESIVLTINSVTFEGAPTSNLMSADIAGSSQTITITDRPTSPRAVISVEEAEIREGDGLSENPNFRITFTNIDSSTPGATSMMNYTFDDGFSAATSSNTRECADGAGKYCAFSSISNSLTGLTNSTGSFSFTVSSINGVNAEISIFILPREDPDAEDETVELTINSITIPQSEGTLTFNMANGNLVNSDDNPTDKMRITITDNDIRLRIRVFLEGALQ